MVLRMITGIHKWDGTGFINKKGAFMSGDAISDLRTRNNTLSVWKVDTQQDIDDAIVALAINRDKVQKLVYLLMDEKELIHLGIKVAENPSDISCIDDGILQKHRDLVDLDYWSLGFIAEYMAGLVGNPNARGVKTDKEVKQMLNEYKDNNRIIVEKVKDSIRKNLTW